MVKRYPTWEAPLLYLAGSRPDPTRWVRSPRRDVLAADELDVEWMLYQAVHKDVMTEQEAEAFRTWFNERPSFEEAPELLQHQPGTIYRPGDGESTSGTSSGFKSY